MQCSRNGFPELLIKRSLTRGVGGGGGNRTHVRKPSAAGVYVDSRSTLQRLVPRHSGRQDRRRTSLKCLAPPLRPGLGPATRIWRPFPNPDGPIRRALTGVRPPELAECRQLYRSHLLTRGEKPRDAAWTSLIPVETCRPPVRRGTAERTSLYRVGGEVTSARCGRRARPCPSRGAPRARAARPACRAASCRGR